MGVTDKYDFGSFQDIISSMEQKYGDDIKSALYDDTRRPSSSTMFVIWGIGLGVFSCLLLIIWSCVRAAVGKRHARRRTRQEMERAQKLQKMSNDAYRSGRDKALRISVPSDGTSEQRSNSAASPISQEVGTAATTPGVTAKTPTSVVSHRASPSQKSSWSIPGAPRDEAHMDTSTVEPWILRALEQYSVHPIRGFLPAEDPIQRLPMPQYGPWEDLADDLGKLLCARMGQARPPLRRLPVISTDGLTSVPMQKRAHLLLSLFAHAYVWGGEEPEDFIPEGIAIPLWDVSEMLDIPPVLGHPSIVLYNWRRFDPGGAICMENLTTLNHFFGSRDENWFYLITVEIEARGAVSIVPLMLCVDAIQQALELLKRTKRRRKEKTIDNGKRDNKNDENNSDEDGDDDNDDDDENEDDETADYESVEDDEDDEGLTDIQKLVRVKQEGGIAAARKTDRNTNSKGKSGFAIEELDPGRSGLSGLAVCLYVTARMKAVVSAIKGMTESIIAMREGCHPFIFYHRVRPFLSAWKQNPTLPRGVLYRGVSEVRQKFYGGSAAQSALLPFLDIMLGIDHGSTKSRIFLKAMREYMHKQHREFLEYMEMVACLRDFVFAGCAYHLNSVPGDEDGTGKVELTVEQKAWAELQEQYNLAVNGMKDFRSGHINLVAEYIIAQNCKDQTGIIEDTAGGKGTGGTDLMKFLKPIRDNCGKASTEHFDFGGVCPMTGAVGDMCPAASSSVSDKHSKGAGGSASSQYSRQSDQALGGSLHGESVSSNISLGSRESNTSLQELNARGTSADPQDVSSQPNLGEVVKEGDNEIVADGEELYVKDNAARGDIDIYSRQRVTKLDGFR